MPRSTSSPAPALLRHRPFALYWYSRTFSVIAFHMQAVAVGWQLYALTGNPLDLGLVGLVQFLPMICLTLLVGQVADRFDRRSVLVTCRLVEGSAAAALALGSLGGWLGREGILFIIALSGAAKAFEDPTMAALVPALVPRALLQRAAALAAAANQVAKVAGPALGGLVYLLGPAAAYATVSTLFLLGALLVGLIRAERTVPSREPVTLASLFSGIAFVRRQPLLLGTLSLDLFVVLLGGATALLPIYARDVLKTGPEGLGLLRAAPGLGAVTMSVVLSRFALRRRVGPILFGSILTFGCATVIFGLSTSMFISLAALFVLGGCDVVSVVIRFSLVQLQTPAVMLGRVSAASSMFVGTSNQLGEFESGLAASLFGAIPAVLFGGFGTITVALFWMLLFPDLRRLRTLGD